MDWAGLLYLDLNEICLYKINSGSDLSVCISFEQLRVLILFKFKGQIAIIVSNVMILYNSMMSPASMFSFISKVTMLSSPSYSILYNVLELSTMSTFPRMVPENVNISCFCYCTVASRLFTCLYLFFDLSLSSSNFPDNVSSFYFHFV